MPNPAEIEHFTCNLCGAGCACPRGELGREVPSCASCGSTVRTRAIVHLVSMAVFGRSLPLPAFPRRKDVRGAGLSDQDAYALGLADRFDYTNTWFHQPPRLDITAPGPEWLGRCDFLVSSDVFEHVVPPVSRAFEGARRVLRPGGTLVLTVPYSTETGQTLEHYPDLHEWSLQARADGGYTVHNRRRDGTDEQFHEPIFHGGPGTTLEMRLFAREALLADLRAAGFRDVRVADEEVPEYGIRWLLPWSLPVVARA